MSDVVLIRALAMLVDVAERCAVDESELVQGLSFRHQDYYEAPPYRRIPWNDFAIYLKRLDAVLEGELRWRMRDAFVERNPYDAFLQMGGLMTSPEAYFWMANRVFAPLVFPVLTIEEERVGKRLRMVSTIEPHLEPCAEFFEISALMLEAGPKIMGMQAAHVVTQASGHGAEFLIDLPPSMDLFSRARRAVDAALNSQVFGRELVEQNKILEESYVALQASEESFRALIEGAPDGVLVRDGGEVLFANQALAEMLGVPQEMLSRRPLEEFLPNLEALEGGGLVVMKGADGEEIQAESREVVARFKGRLARVSLLRDVTLRNEVMARAMDMDRLITMGTLSAGIAHEINNPIAVVQANLSFARDELAARGDEELAEVLAALDDSISGVERATEIARELRDVGRQCEESQELVEPQRIVKEALRWVKPGLMDRADLQVNLELCAPVETNQPRAQQVVLNLLLNATQALDPGNRRQNRVEVRTYEVTRQGSWAVIEVVDTGKGMSEAELARAFEPFYTTKERGEGTGLGLFISRDIASRLGGFLELESEPGVGTTARLLLPY